MGRGGRLYVSASLVYTQKANANRKKEKTIQQFLLSLLFPLHITGGGGRAVGQRTSLMRFAGRQGKSDPENGGAFAFLETTAHSLLGEK